MDKEMEDEIVVWIKELRAKRTAVWREDIAIKALEIDRRKGNIKFKATKPWVSKFLKRNNFSLRKVTKTGRKTIFTPEDVVSEHKI